VVKRVDAMWSSLGLTPAAQPRKTAL
jgi:hypothetical protein